jgi:hypothetical protein
MRIYIAAGMGALNSTDYIHGVYASKEAAEVRVRELINVQLAPENQLTSDDDLNEAPGHIALWVEEYELSK